MFLRNPTLLAVSLLLAAVAGGALAGDREHRHRSHDRESGHNRHRDHGNHGVTSPDGLPSVIPGIGTFSGAISAVRIQGVGNYIMVSGNLGRSGDVILAPKAKIIEIEGTDACSYEAGVCVVRP